MTTIFRTIEVSDPAFEVEGLRQVTVYSDALGRRGDCTVWAPGDHAGPLPLVILLHGVYGSHWAWAAKAGAHRLARTLVDERLIPPVALAMPSDGLFGLGSGYVGHSGGDFAGWIVHDVPALASAVVAVDAAAPIAVGGLSMGGFGALLLGARHGHRVVAAAGMSAITNFDQMALFVGDIDAYDVDHADRSVLAAMLTHREQLPAIRLDCGTEDLLIEHNRILHAALDAHGIPHEYAEHPGGHSWEYWRTHLAETLRSLAGAFERPTT